MGIRLDRGMGKIQNRRAGVVGMAGTAGTVGLGLSGGDGQGQQLEADK